ncbi:hypothetical protein Q8A67_020468 [Cirrhinus molitorella]|uniref:Uncharacterized protein n=1 Tax=Cirrhinus molitorella TaxID=172907 RepID=A0AA88P7T2_9TELE|nr:hypothetical protein Q8A67_020468 [Cirrhinus molitorella]
MELDPGSASHPSHHNHYQSRWEDGEGGQERKREGERTNKMRTKEKTLGTERKSLSYTVSFPGDRSNAPGDRLLPSSC